MDTGCKQLLLCITKDTSAKVIATEKIGNKFRLIKEINAHIGQKGASYNIHEGSLMTPKGLFSISFGFYKEKRPESGIQLFKIEENTVWVDDPKSKFYNQKADKSVKCDSCEDMYNIKGYECGFVIDYNTKPVIPDKGSAIFFHIGDKPTKGCIAAKKEDLLYLLTFLDKAKSPHILII